LEWNTVGLSDRGMEALSNAIIANKTLETVDLRNNRIGSTSSVYICDIIRQSSLQTLDLRWNELGSQGSKGIVSAIQTNGRIKQIDLAGNKINEDFLALVEEALSKNRLATETKSSKMEKEIIKTMFSPSKTAPTFYYPEENAEVDTTDRVRMLDIKTRYDAELIERERTERKLGEAETQLNQERQKNSEIREELLKAVEAEKAVNESK
jgi:hypothetical protein